LTKQTTPDVAPTAALREFGAGASEIEITPAMIKAGVDAYVACDREFDSIEKIITDVFQAMMDTTRQPKCAAVSNLELAPQSHWWLS
jgi:hypothetical protein